MAAERGIWKREKSYTMLLNANCIIAIPPKPEEPLRHAIPSTGVKFPIMMLNIRWNCYKAFP